MSIEACRASLLAARNSINAALALLEKPVEPIGVSALEDSTPVAAAATRTCAHPSAKRESMGGFGPTGRGWCCGVCGYEATT